MSVAINEADVVIRYVKNEESVHSIAKACGTYPVKIFRILKKQGIALRDPSHAQKLSLAKGRRIHPTEGKERTEEEKLKISEGRYQAWKESGTEAHAERCKKIWKEKSESELQVFNKKGKRAIREASIKGSKLERYLWRGLINSGYLTKFHTESLISNELMHLDLYIPSIRTAIEVDGPSHFEPIWGQENMQKHKRRDRAKTGLLISSGYNLIRIKSASKSLSEAKKRESLKNLLDIVKQIGNNDKGKQFYMEVV